MEPDAPEQEDEYDEAEERERFDRMYFDGSDDEDAAKRYR